MPYTCVVENGALDLKRSEPITYLIEGKRRQRVFRACSRNRLRSDIQDCRTMVLHRFAIACGGRSVDWMAVVAAMPKGNGVVRAWLEDGALNLALTPRWRAIQSNLGRVLVHAAPSGKKRAAHFVFPEHFAPLSEFGARLILASSKKEKVLAIDDVIVPPEPSYLRVAFSKLETSNAGARDMVRRVDGHGVSDIQKNVAEAQLSLADDPKPAGGEHWDATIIKSGEQQGQNSSEDHRALMVLIVGLILLTTATIIVFPSKFRSLLRIASVRELSELAVEGPRSVSNGRRWRQDLRGLWARIKGKFGMIYNDLAMRNGVGSVESQIAQTAKLVSGLDRAPLRETLENELRGLRERVHTLQAAEMEKKSGRGGGVRTDVALRNIVRELNRISRIAESAAVSLSEGTYVTFMPQTRSEAFQVLGVNANVSDATLKKVIDGLRMSWHPDLARNEKDRALYNERIKQINRAWELVGQKSCSTGAGLGHMS